MRLRKDVFFVVAVCCQLSLFTILIYIYFIRSCSETPIPIRVQDWAKQAATVSYISNLAGTAYNKISLFTTTVTPTVSLSKRSDVQGNNSNGNKFVNFKTVRADNRTYDRVNETSIALMNTESRRKRRLKLVVAILSAPIRFDRREGIRRTWMNQCTSEEVVCRFFTDSLSDMEPKVQGVLANESAKYGDMEFMPIPKGYNFGLRLLWLMEWSMERYEFDFFLRMDDDYFVCLKRLLFEIPFRPQKR